MNSNKTKYSFLKTYKNRQLTLFLIISLFGFASMLNGQIINEIHDKSFDFEGVAMVDINMADQAKAVAIQPDGKIVVGGHSGMAALNDFTVVRLNTDGSLDTDFDSDGKVTTTVTNVDDYLEDLAIQADGKIVAVGSANSDIAIVRYNTDGSLDTGFNSDGIDTLNINSTDYAKAVAIQSDGKIVVGGYTGMVALRDFIIVRYNSDGSLDTGFDTDGKVVTAVSGVDDYLEGLAIQSDGKIIAVGYSNNDIAVVRYNTDGSLDTGFGSNGIIIQSVNTGGDYAYNVAIQEDGKIVVAGTTDNGTNIDFVLLRLNNNGSLDTGFDTDGIVTSPISAADESGRALAIQSDGKIVIAGYVWTPTGKFMVLRYKTDGSIDAGFANNGKKVDYYGSYSNHAYAVALQSDGKIVVAGSINNGTDDDFGVARYTGATQLLPTATEQWTGGGAEANNGIPLNTYYHDNLHQSLYLASDLTAVGVPANVNITAIEFIPSEYPGMAFSDFRVGIAPTTNNNLGGGFESTDVVYGPIYHNVADFTVGDWFQFDINDVMWDGTKNIVVEFSHDNNNFALNGGIYLREAGINRSARGWSDSNNGNYPFNGLGTNFDNKVAALRILYTPIDVLPPSNLILTAGDTEVGLSWTASNDSDLSSYVIYRGTSSGGLSPVDSVNSSTASYTDTGLANGTTYYYGVKAKNSANEYSALTNVESAVPHMTVIDIDGNIYYVVQIGNQYWMAENLKVTKYRNGDAIPKETNNSIWSNTSSGAYCNYNNDNNNVATYGSLYNWFTLVDNRNIAPPGWHVPTDTEWKELEITLGMSQAEADLEEWRGTNEGSKLKSSTDWNGTDNYGFSALPSGYRSWQGDYSFLGENGHFWSSTETSDGTVARDRTLIYAQEFIGRFSSNIHNGYSVRLVKGIIAARFLSLTSGDGKIDLSWTASSEDSLTNYIIYRGTSVGSLSPVDSVSNTVTTYSNTGLTNGTTYYFGVKAKNNSGEYSPMTNVESATPVYLGPVWWITTSANGGSDSNDGSSSAPFLTVSKGTQMAASGDTIMVRAGTYTGSGYRGLNPGGINMVIMSESGAASTTLDANYGDRHFLIENGEDTTMQIIGFTFINGSTSSDGGSIFFNDWIGYPTNSAIIKDCVFRNNETTGSSASGGAINVNNSSPIFRNCVIDGNSSIGYGGGVAVINSFSAPKFQNCTIINNDVSTAAGTGISANGGGIYVQQGTPVFVDCIIDSNTVTSGGQNGNGGGVFVDWFDNSGVNPVKFIRCFIRENNVIAWGTWEANGGGLAVQARTELINCVITNNYTSPVNGTSYGGGIAVDLWANYNQHEVKIINCTIAQNEANAPYAQSNSHGGGIYLDWDEIAIIFNTILWGNTAEVDANIADNGANMATNNNNIENGEQFNWFATTSLTLDPQFTNSVGDDFSISDASYNIGAGTSGFGGYSAPANDILGNARPDPAGSNPDIGAYENSLAISPYPGQVANLVGQAGHQKVILTWDANSESDLNRYAIYQSTTQDFTPTTSDSIGEIAVGTETFTATGLTNGTPYFYQVTVIDDDGYEGLPSFEIGVTPRYTGPVWYVDDVGTNGEGSSTSPFNQIQAAIDSAAAGTDTVMVLPGTYEGVGNFEIYLSNKDLIITSEKGADSTILSSDNNHRHFSISNGVSPNTNIIGFTFKNGQPGNNEYEGGSIWIDGASPQFYNCTFTQNEAENGGAVAVMWSGGLPGFNNCVFRDNVASNTNGEANGGAVFIADFNYASNPIEFNNCTFDRNRVEAKNSARGGALAIYTRVAFENCLIVNNKATAGYQNYTAGETAFGGGIFIQTNNNNVGEIVSMVNTTVANDTAIYGVMGNSIGGGIYLDGWPDQKFDMFNSIVWGNHAVQSGQENIDDGGYSTFRADYNIIENGNEFNRWFYIDNHNQMSDPQFVDAENGNYQLSDFSPAIGAGWTGWQTYTAPSTDIDGNARPYGAGGVYPDLGAYENPLGVSPYPRQVQNLFAEGASYAVDLTWDENPDVNGNIDYYIVYMDTLADFIATVTDSVGKEDQDAQVDGKFTHTISNLQNNTPYYFRIAAHNSAAYTGVTSEIASAQPGYSDPIWYVDDNGDPDNADGSPEKPFQTIGAAWGEGIANPNFSGGDTIMVLPGTYQRFYDLDLVAPNMPFVLMSQEGPDTTFIDGRLNGSTAQKPFIRFDFGADTTTQIIGFTIQNCTSTENGGAVKLMSGSNLKFMNCTFANNFVSTSDRNGGAVYIDQSSPYFLNCSFINNSAGNDGGAVSIGSSSPRFENCVFRNNSAYNQGGAVYIWWFDSRPSFENCDFESNQTTNTDWNSRGGAIASDEAINFSLNRCTFVDNSSWEKGAAIYFYFNQTYTAWAKIKNSLFTGNTIQTNSFGDHLGTTIFLEGENSRLLLEGVTIVDNAADKYGSALHFWSGGFITNSIIWDNSTGEFDERTITNDQWGSDTQIQYSLVENGDLIPVDITCLTVDPLFNDAANDNYTLSEASYAIGAGYYQYNDPSDGNQLVTITSADMDLAGAARVQPADTTILDMGAFERPEAVSLYPDSPTNLIAEELDRAVRLSWDSVTATDVAYYIIYQAIEPDSTNFDSIATVLPGLSTFVDTVANLTNMTKYYFGIGAVDSSGYESMMSDDIVAVPHYQGPVWYVATDVPSGTGEGSINDPYGNIRKAIFNSNDGDTIFLRPGTYSGNDNRDLNFQQVDEFGGMTTTPRDIVLMGEKGPDSTIIDLSGFGATQRRLLDVTSGEGPNTKLIGLTIQNGEANSEPMIRVENSDLTIENCYFIENINTGEFGAVVLTGNDQSQIDVSNSRFIRNTGSNSVGVFFADNIDITNSIFYQNSARTGAAFGWNPSGGSASSIVNCLFLENISTEYGSGGAIWIQPNSGVSIYNSIFWDNINSGGGDQDVAGQNGVHNCSVQDLTSYSADNYSFNPMIVDPENGDFSLSEYSPAIGLGVDQYFDFTSSQYEDIPESDYNENMRPDPVGSSSDLGPIEHQNAEPRQWVYYASNSGNDSNDGKSTQTAFLTIQHAIDNADDLDTVEVLAGTYIGTGNQDLDFFGKNIVLRSSDGPDLTILDLENNAYAFDFYSFEPLSARIIGFTVQNGNFDNGGAVHLQNASPRFDNMRFINNHANFGGGVIHAENSDSRFINSIFVDNVSDGEAAVAKIIGGNVVFRHCTITNNQSDDDNGFVFDGGSHTIKNTIFWNNNIIGNGILNINGNAQLDITYSDIMGGYEGTRNLNHRPGFVDANLNDFDLEDWSPMIGAADTSNFSSKDYDYNQRSLSDTTAPDIGAFESELAVPDTSIYESQIWFVDENGDDANDGSLGLPFGTIQRAVDYAIWADEVSIQNGIYNQSVDIWGKDISIYGNGEPFETEIIGEVFIKRGESPLFSNLKMRNDGITLQIAGESTPTFEFIEFSGSTGGFLAQIWDASPLFNHVTFADNGANAIYSDASASVSVTNSIFWNTGSHYELFNGGTVSISYSLTDSLGTGNISSEPQFLAASDYHLFASSFCVNGGDPSMTDDDETRADMGAYPYFSNNDGPVWSVSESGSDETGSGHSDFPFASLQAAVNFALDNHIVEIGSGTFVGNTELRDHDIIVSGIYGETILDANGNGTVLYIPSGLTSSTVIENLIITGGYAERGAGINIFDSSPTIRNNIFTDNESTSFGSAIYTLYSNSIFEYNLIYENIDDAIMVENGATVFVNNTIANNVGVGLRTASNATPIEIRNSIFFGNSSSLDGDFDVTYSDIEGGATGTGNIESDPLFVDALNGNYSLELLSPCVDAGDSTDTFDSDSTFRDMGALPIFRNFVGGNTAGTNVEVNSDTTVVVDTDLTIDAGDSLVINPGATLYLGNGVTLTINGILAANGNVLNPVLFTTLYPGEFFGGITLAGELGTREDYVYEYLTISNVATGSIPLTVTGNATLEHFTIAGNDSSINSLETDGAVTVNYSIFESTAGGSGIVTTMNSFIDDTTHFVNWSGGDYELLVTSTAIDIGVDESESNIDPDYTYSDAGAHYHNQSTYMTNTASVIYPVFGDTIEVSPDTSAFAGLDVFSQTWNEFGRYKTNASINWDVGTINGSFGDAITDTTDLDGESMNLFHTSTQTGDLNQFTISSDGVNATSGFFRVVSGMPDSAAVLSQENTEMTQLDTISIEVNVFDQFDNLVQDGESVSWTVVPIDGDGSGFGFINDMTTTQNGIASVELITDPNTTLMVGHRIQVQAVSVGALVLSDTVMVVPDDIFNLRLAESLTQNQIDLSADIHSMEISATMIDTFDNPLENVELFWDLVDLGHPEGLLDVGSSFTNENGIASTVLTTGTVTDYQYQIRGWVTEQSLIMALQNQMIPDAIQAPSVITTKGTKSTNTIATTIPINVVSNRTVDFSREEIFDLDDTTAVINVISGVSNGVTFDLVNDTTLTQFESLPMTVTVYDQYGNLVADGTNVDWIINPVSSGISLDVSSSTTTNGIATNIVSTDPTAILNTIVTIEATSGVASMVSNSITITTGDPHNLVVTDSYDRNPVADQNTVPLEVTIIDTFDNVLDGIPVYWSIVEGAEGYLENNYLLDTSYTDISGTATNMLITDVVAGSYYKVRMWVENSGGFTLRNTSQSQDVKTNIYSTNPKNTGKEFVGEVAERSHTDVMTFGRSEMILDDTTDVISILPGAPSTIVADNPDTTYVLQGQIDTLNIEVMDQFGNYISDGSVVNWNASVTSDYSITEANINTTNGLASIIVAANNDAPWLSQIDFSIVVESIFNSSAVGKDVTYRIEDVIAPDAVSALSVNPAVWTSTNNFTLSWTNPIEHSGVAGAYYQIDSESPVYVESSEIITTDISLPINAKSTVALWLQDNAGNVDAANAVTIQAMWDDIAPNSFTLVSPSTGSWLNNPDPVFEWGTATDDVAGMDHYRFELDGTPYVIPPDSNTFVIPTSLSEGAHTLLIVAVDSAGNEKEMDFGQISFSTDYTQPNIVHNQVLEGTENQVLAISATFNDPSSGSGVVRRELYYRQGGETAWLTPVNLESGSYSIASSYVKSSGVEYYIEAEDVAGNIRKLPNEGFYSISVTIPSGIPGSRKWPTGIPNGATVADYQLISFPANPANNTPTDVLVTNTIKNLGAYDDTKWRFFTYSANAWVEFANISKIESGVGYFIIVKDADQNINTGQASSVATDEPYQINLPAGEWVMIGNPFDFEIPLPNVYDQDSVSIEGNPNFYTWNGEWVAATVLKPWQGYIYKSTIGGQLFMNPRKQNGGQARIAYQEEIELIEDEWLIDIDVKNGFANDRSNRIGVLTDALDQYDEWDAFEPPIVPGGVSLRIDNTHWDVAKDIYTTDIKSVSEQGHFWDLNVVAQDADRNVIVTFDGISDIPEDFDIFLIDKSIGTAQNLSSRDTYIYPAGRTSKQRDFRLVIGTREFVEENNAGVSLYPDAFALSQNFPNPFNPKTTILLSIEDEAVVDLVVYNLLGETVTTLAQEEYLQPGYYNFIWSGYNEQGNRVASGLYLYSTIIKSPSGKVLLNQTRKMIFVK